MRRNLLLRRAIRVGEEEKPGWIRKRGAPCLPEPNILRRQIPGAVLEEEVRC